MKNLIICFLFMVSAISVSGQVKSRRTNPVYRQILNAQDTRNTAELMSFAKHRKAQYRKWAVIALASVQDTVAAPMLIELLNNKKYKVKKEAAYSLGQLRRTWLQSDLIRAYHKERKMSVKTAILAALGKCAGSDAIHFYEGVELPGNKPQLQTAWARSVFYAARKGFKSDSVLGRLKTIATQGNDTFIRYVYFNLSKKRMTPLKTVIARGDISLYDALDTINRIEGPYEKVSFLKKYYLNKEGLLTIAFSNESHFLRSYCMEEYFKEETIDEAVIDKCLSSRNIAFIGMAAERIRTDSLWLDEADKKIKVLRKIQQNLLMPMDFEAWVELEKTVCFLQHSVYTYRPPLYNHAISWTYMQGLKDVEQVRIRTNKGSMIMNCYVNEAPASAANFLNLVDSGYYNEKYFHRMVPDFVVQGGCPRGDGWGALNWTQRSEFSPLLNYKKGSVGLASAGKDSEGVQFFITHGFTPSLDGRYTIFGEISEGLEVIDKLKIGDMILSMERVR